MHHNKRGYAYRSRHIHIKCESATMGSQGKDPLPKFDPNKEKETYQEERKEVTTTEWAATFPRQP